MKKLITIYFLLTLPLVYKAQNENGILVKYSFNDGKVVEETGDKEVKAYNISLIEDRFGNKNSACYLHGNFDSYINLGSSKKIKPIKGTFSVWFTIFTPMLKGNGVEIIPLLMTKAHSGEDCNEAIHLGYDLNTENMDCSMALSRDKQITVRSAKKTALNQWHHAVICYDNDLICFYLDGILFYEVIKIYERTNKNCYKRIAL